MSEGTVSAIRVRGARVHNLRDIDVDIPHGKLVALTGLSGSGKSSLAFDTLHAEGQRRFLETLSSYARQMVEQLEPPDVDLIEGLPPTVAVDQKSGASSPRSTVATITEAHDYLRLLYARTGMPHCPNCGHAIERQTPEQMLDVILRLPASTKLVLLAPLVRRRKGAHVEVFAAIRRAGLIRARIDGSIVDILDDPPKLAKTKPHTIEAVVDRLVIREGLRPRLAESIDRAVQLGMGTLIVSVINDAGEHSDRVLSAQLSCPECAQGLEPLEPGLFSPNSPLGACPTCSGLGEVEGFEAARLITDLTRSLADGGIAVLDAFGARPRETLLSDAGLQEFLRLHRVSLTKPLADWPPRVRESMLRGKKGADTAEGFSGLVALLETAYADASSARRAAMGEYRSSTTCPSCNGTRLNAQARAVTVGDHSLPTLLALSPDELERAVKTFTFGPEIEPVAAPIIREVVGRARYLQQIGLDYLTFDRSADTLSGGELQRVRLASQLGSGLVGVCYILDEPTSGLHPSDTDKLLDTLHALRDAGNSVIVVEHDEHVIRSSDWVIDIGPGAGPDGGRVVALGPPDGLSGPESHTARWLKGASAGNARPSGRLERSPGAIEIEEASEHNLKSIHVCIPLATLVCVAGVSGSGKSTLVQDVLAAEAARLLYRSGRPVGAHGRITGLEAIDKLVAVDQTPIGRTPRSTPATYTGVFDEIRRVFAATRDAKIRGFKSGRFSFNSKGGRCEACQGQGFRRLEMQYLPDLFVRCDVCEGTRFNRATLEVRYKGRNVAEVLDMRVDQALDFFDAIPKVRQALQALHRAGLGYMTLGQSSTTLSGGESQRVKLAAELAKAATGRTLYILDEPTTGLHADDVKGLIGVLEELADLGNTVVLIEHNLDVIRAADWVIDLGPGGGSAGGHVVVQGTVDAVMETAGSATGNYLAQISPAPTSA